MDMMMNDNFSDRLYVGGFSSTLSSEQIKTLILQSSTPFDVKVDIVENGSRKHRGFAFVQCQNQSDAAILLTKYLTVFSKVNFAKKESKPPSTIMSNISNVFVRGLSKTLSDSKLFELFGGSSQGVVQCHVADGYGFVLFDTRKNAEKKIEEMDGQIINGQKISLTWARPDTSCRKRKRCATDAEVAQLSPLVDLSPILKRSMPMPMPMTPLNLQLQPFLTPILNPATAHLFMTNPTGLDQFLTQPAQHQMFNFLM